ncbi:DNA polymerase I [Athalassotoga saccharophila]|uniref:DNA polymerase I n=1 Tax=Athalassotoga saccharophila TaxID=1441386 RepID=UPI001379E437|nr:DNA polymerase I [Athalassotoga saccharophila]BBJ28923.1 DNA polymerase I [Athalassotoga saccharophila]
MNLYIFDGTALVYRAYYALPPLSTSDGKPTGAVLGVAKMLLKFIKERVKEGDSIIFVMDSKEQNFRKTLFESYKANRAPAPYDMISQISYIERLVEGLGMPILKGTGYEADDVIATLVKKYSSKFDGVYIVTGDKDLLQLVGGNVKVLRFASLGISDLVEYDEKMVIERYGLKPSQIGDYLALVGDASDNIPGVKGIGEKSATELLKKYGDLQNLYDHLEEIPQRYSKLLVDGKEMMKLSKELVNLSYDVPLNLEISPYKGPDRSKLLSIFNELELNSLKSEFDLYEHTSNVNYVTIDSKEKLQELISNLIKKSFVAFDTETTSLDPFEAKLVGFSLCDGDQSYYVPIKHKNGKNVDNGLEILKSFLENENVKIIGQNLKYDLEIMMNNSSKFKPYFDTMIAAYLLDPNERKFSLEELGMKYLNYSGISYEDITKGKNFEEVSIEDATKYSAEDADMTYKLYNILNQKLIEEDLMDVFYKIEMPLVGVLARMEMNGVYIDKDFLKSLSESYNHKLRDIESQIYDLAGGMPFNINSPKQLSEVLFSRLKLKPRKKTSTRAFSTDAGVLEEMRDEHPIIPLLLEYRKYFKLKSTYIDALPKLVNPKTGRLHTSFNQTGTSTGRLSSSDPNLQNIPSRNEEGLEIRKAIRAQNKEWKIISFDYSQIELRVLAHMSGDPALIEAFKSNYDIHAITAAKIYGVNQEDVTSEMRRIGKMVNFAVTYGVSAYGLSKRLGIPVEDSDKIIKNYFASYPMVKKYLDDIVNFAIKNGYVETIFGRKRDIPELKSSNRNVFEEGKRMAINAPIQGSAADIIKLAMIDIDQKISSMRSMMILQVHDELVFEVPQEEIEEITKIVKDSMENIVKMKVPLKVEIELGESW